VKVEMEALKAAHTQNEEASEQTISDLTSSIKTLKTSEDLLHHQIIELQAESTQTISTLNSKLTTMQQNIHSSQEAQKQQRLELELKIEKKFSEELNQEKQQI